MNSIKDVRQKMKLSKTVLIGAGVATGIALGVIGLAKALIAAGVKGVSGIVAKIQASKILGKLTIGTALFTAVTTMVGSVLGASRKYEDVKDYYVDVRSYGKQYS